MTRRHVVVPILCAAAAMAFTAAAFSQVQRVPAKRLDTVDGAQAYAAYCASCHGEKGKGDGKAAAFLKEPVPDLTTIAARYGKFDSLAVLHTIEGPTPATERVMPCWPAVLSPAYPSSSGPRLILRNIVRHLETLQAPAR